MKGCPSSASCKAKIIRVGGKDATTDLYYWVAYLTDSLTFNNTALLANHVGWLCELARQNNTTGEHIRLSLIALGQAIKTWLPNQARGRFCP